MAIKIALAGIGKIARDQHIPAILESGEWDLAATVSRHGTLDGTPAYTDLETLLAERPDIECISLCMPPVPRFSYAVAALAAGRHVMLEKPPGASLSECRILESMARKTGLALYATWHSREAAMVDAARDWLAGRRLRKLEITWKEDVRKWHPGQHWIWQAGGLGVFDPGINALSIMTRILPTPVHLTSARLSFPENCETPIAAELDFHHPGGAEVHAEFDFRQERGEVWTISAETDDGKLLLSEGGANLSIDGNRHTDSANSGSVIEGEYPRLYANMAGLIRSRAVDMDLSPMMHVADAFLLGRRIVVEPFFE